MPNKLLPMLLAAGLLLPGAGRASAADPEAQRRQYEQQRQHLLQQERANLDQQIRAGQRQLEQAKQQAEQIRKALPELKKQFDTAMKIAEQFKPEVAGQQQEVENARKSQKDATDKVRELRSAMIKAGDDLEKQQPTDAPISRARSQLEQTQSKYDALSKQIMESPEYKAAFQAAQEAGGALKAGEVRSAFFKENAAFVGVQGELKANREAYDALRKKLVEGSPDYQRAAETYQSAQAEMTAAGKQVEEVNKRLNQAKATLNGKLALARKLDAQGRDGQARIKQLEHGQQQIARQIAQLQNRRNNLR